MINENKLQVSVPDSMILSRATAIRIHDTFHSFS